MAPVPGSRFEAWLTAQVRRRVFPMAAAAQPPRKPPAEKALARKLHFDQGKHQPKLYIPAAMPNVPTLGALGVCLGFCRDARDAVGTM